MKIYTIGFTKKSAENFFERIKQAGIKTLVDVRLNNSSQLAAFAKKNDLAYFLGAICGVKYIHLPLLAPEAEMLNQFKKMKGSWSDYERSFIDLLRRRKIERSLDRRIFEEPCVLLCSEDKPHHCHRRLVAEYLQQAWPDVQVEHL